MTIDIPVNPYTIVAFADGRIFCRRLQFLSPEADPGGDQWAFATVTPKQLATTVRAAEGETMPYTITLRWMCDYLQAAMNDPEGNPTTILFTN